MQKRSCNVVVLAAGLGQRFSTHGIAIPKPLIHFRGRSLLDRTLDVARDIIVAQNGRGRIVVVATEPVAQVAWRGLVAPSARRAKVTDHKVVPVSVTQRGPVGSALLAMAHLPPDEQVMFMDCDNYFPSEARSWVETFPAEANFIVVGDVPRGLKPEEFCNVVVSEDGERALVIGEKVNLGTGTVGVGVYGFSSATHFARCAWRLFADRDLNDAPMSKALTSEDLGGAPVFVVEAEAWAPIGTPQQMEAAELYGPQGPTTNE